VPYALKYTAGVSAVRVQPLKRVALRLRHVSAGSMQSFEFPGFVRKKWPHYNLNDFKSAEPAFRSSHRVVAVVPQLGRKKPGPKKFDFEVADPQMISRVGVTIFDTS
jgi:hypothetical protein